MDITSVNSTFFLSITGLFDAPVQLQQFATEDLFDTQPLKPAEVVRGGDGEQAGGLVFVSTEQSVHLLAGSSSVDIFEQWFQTQYAQLRLFIANGVIRLPSVGKKYTMTEGILTTYSPLSDAKKTLTPRTFGITWKSVASARI